MTNEWITDRLPTAADADGDGKLRLLTRFGATLDRGWSYCHHTLVAPGQPWWSRNAAKRAEMAAPAPAPELTRKVVQIAAFRNRLGCLCELFALCNDGTMWTTDESGPWSQLPAIPQPEA